MPTKCSSCNGEYEPIQADGSKYFHACPDGTTNPRNENVKFNETEDVYKERVDATIEKAKKPQDAMSIKRLAGIVSAGKGVTQV